ncbi:hypothetical protein GH714_040583, partial [Hevea brasiliensis]
MPVSISAKPRSSRLKDKQKGEGERLVKELFVNNVIHNNGLLHVLGKGSSIVLLPRSSSDMSVCSNLRVGSQLRVSSSLGLCSSKGIMKSSKDSVPDEVMPEMNNRINQVKGLFSMKEKFASLCERNRFSSLNGNDSMHNMDTGTENGGTVHGDKLSDQRLFSCVTCGILSFDCIAIIQPREAAARYLMSADCSFFNDWIVGSGVTNDGFTIAHGDTHTSEQNSSTKWMKKNTVDGLYDVPVQSANCQIQMIDQNKVASNTETQKGTSSLSLLALNYGNSSDSEEDQHRISALPSLKQECHQDEADSRTLSSARPDCGDEVTLQSIDCHAEHGHGNRPANFKDESDRALNCSVEFETDNLASMESNGLEHTFREYPRIEAVARSVSEELGIECLWNDINFRDATKEDEENIQSALDSEEAIPGNGDWAVKLGINLFYSANLSRSSLYSKQMPYNSVIYNAFGRSSPASSPTKFNVYGRKPSKQKKVVAGRWCGKVWMSNQVHPFLTKRDSEDQDQEQEKLPWLDKAR